MDAYFAVGHADVDVHAKNEVGSGGLLQLLYNLLVAGMVCDGLGGPVAERVGASGGNDKIIIRG